LQHGAQATVQASVAIGNETIMKACIVDAQRQRTLGSLVKLPPNIKLSECTAVPGSVMVIEPGLLQLGGEIAEDNP
jgi:hypothetical protein